MAKPIGKLAKPCSLLFFWSTATIIRKVSLFFGPLIFRKNWGFIENAEKQIEMNDMSFSNCCLVSTSVFRRTPIIDTRYPRAMRHECFPSWRIVCSEKVGIPMTDVQIVESIQKIAIRHPKFSIIFYYQ